MTKIDNCPRCDVRFSEWFFWPDIGNYCWPCWNKYRRIYIAPWDRNRESTRVAKKAEEE